MVKHRGCLAGGVHRCFAIREGWLGVSVWPVPSATVNYVDGPLNCLCSSSSGRDGLGPRFSGLTVRRLRASNLSMKPR
jgi:hypothetical protein